MVAAGRGHGRIVSLLLGAGVDIDSQNVEGHTALMFAMNGRSQVRSLQRSSVDMMETENEIVSRSLEEALSDHNKIVAALLQAGADVTCKDKENHRASDFDI